MIFLCKIKQKFGLDRAVFLCYNTTVKKPNRTGKTKKIGAAEFYRKTKRGKQNANKQKHSRGRLGVEGVYLV